jgi:hypothetical protein
MLKGLMYVVFVESNIYIVMYLFEMVTFLKSSHLEDFQSQQ